MRRYEGTCGQAIGIGGSSFPSCLQQKLGGEGLQVQPGAQQLLSLCVLTLAAGEVGRGQDGRSSGHALCVAVSVNVLRGRESVGERGGGAEGKEIYFKDLSLSCGT